MALVKQIMTTSVATVFSDQSISDAREILKNYRIRHLPIINREHALVGLLTQKAVLSFTLRTIESSGIAGLAEIEKSQQVVNIMEQKFPVVSPDTDLIVAGRHFIDHKHGCLPVVENGRLVGIISSIDFVVLAVELLEGG